MMLKGPIWQWLLLFLSIAAYIWLPVWTIGHALNSNDFKHIYLGMKALLDGNSPYPIQSLHHQAALQGYRQISLNPYVYLPFTGQAMAFLAPFQLHQAVNVWFFLNHCFVGASIYILCQMFTRWKVAAAAAMVFSLALSTPLYRTLSAGQLNVALLFLICLAWREAHRGRMIWCGIIMAFAALFKLMPGIYGLYFLLRRQWRGAVAMVIAGSSMLMLSAAVAGIDIYKQFFPVLGQMGYGKSTWPHVFSFWDDPTNQSFNSFFTHILSNNDHTTPWFSLGQIWANRWTYGSTATLLLAYLTLAAIKRPRLRDKAFTVQDDAVWCSTLIVALLIPSLMWDHYLVMLLMPVAWMVKISMEQRRLWTFSLVIVCYLVTCVPWHYESTKWQQGAGILLMSLKLWPTLLLFGLSLCFIEWTGKGFLTAAVRPADVSLSNQVEPEQNP